MADYKDFTINTAASPPPWGPTEEQLWKDAIDTLVIGTVEGAKDESNGHRHHDLYDTNGVLAVDIDNVGKVSFKNGTDINEFSTDGTLAGDSDDALPTEKAVKTYVDTQLTAEDLDIAGDSGTGSVDLDSQSLTIAGTANRVVTSASGQTLTITGPQDIHSGATPTFAGMTVVNAITEFSTDGTLAGDSDSALPTEKAVKTYVDAQITAEDLDIAGDSGTGSVDLDSQSLTIAGTANQVITVAGSQTVTLSLPQNIHSGATPTFGGLTIDGTTLLKDALQFTQVDGNENIDSLNDGYLDYSATTQHRFHGAILVDNKIAFTQVDGNEYIDSITDGYLDYLATTQHRFQAPSGVILTANQAALTTIEVSNNNAGGSCQFELDGVGQSAYLLNDNANSMTELGFAHNELRIRDRGTDPYIRITNVGAEYTIDTEGTGATNLVLGSDGNPALTINGQNASFPDVYTVPYTDYSGITSVFGFAGAPSVKVKYKLIGKQLYCLFRITGTSNSALFQFTLPWNPLDNTQHIGTCVAEDNGADVVEGGSISSAGAGGTININKFQGFSIWASNNWTNSGTKSAQGAFTYEIA